jgi:hypothetical protein
MTSPPASVFPEEFAALLASTRNFLRKQARGIALGTAEAGQQATLADFAALFLQDYPPAMLATMLAVALSEEEEPPAHAHEATGPAGCRRCQLLRDNESWMR